MSIAEEKYVTLPEARAKAGLSRFQFLQVMKNYPLRTQQFPGCRVRVLMSDVERLIEESNRLSTSVK